MNNFNVIIPLAKGLPGELVGVASTDSIDHDDEKMSMGALKMMVDDIKSKGVNLFGNHEHNWENTLGVIREAEMVNNQVQIGITLDDSSTNPKVPMLLNKLKRGIKLGLSVGGYVEGFSWEYDKTLGKKVKVLDKVRIYEVSVVGIPSNSDSFCTLPMAIAKSANFKFKTEKSCPVCLNKMQDSCPVCFYEEE